MHVDVIIPTLNRATQVRRAVTSILVAQRQPGVRLEVVVVDNNSTDETPAVVEQLAREWGDSVRYVFEPRAGKSHALNAGIASSRAAIIGFIDDDEEIDRTWLERAIRAFADPAVDFIGGPYVPVWQEQPPAWLPPRHRAAVGIVDGSAVAAIFGRPYHGVLMGGNAVIRRAVLERAGPFRPDLGPNRARRLMACEDEDLYLRLLAAGATGWYLPDLIVYHHVPPERLTKNYHRRWCFWHGVSQAVLRRHHRVSVPTVAGVPRYLYGDLLRAGGKLLWGSPRGSAAERFDAELTAWDLLGVLYGRYLFKSADDQEPVIRTKPDDTVAKAVARM